MSDGAENLEELLQGLEMEDISPDGEDPVMDEAKMKEFIENLKVNLRAGAAGAGAVSPGYAIHPLIFVAAAVILFSFVGTVQYRI
jgi:hypothetical protein